MLTIDHNLINGPTQIYGDDAVIADPKFVNPSGADFHLREGSPAIDNGSAVDTPSDDFDGNPRPQGAGYDIGAFEFMGTGVDVLSNGKSLALDLFQNYPNPFNTLSNQYQIFTCKSWTCGTQDLQSFRSTGKDTGT